MSKNLDVIDVLTNLKKKYPHVELVVEEVEKPIGRDYYKFYLKKLFDTTFEPPIKTSISMLKNNEISTKDYQLIEKMMDESFSQAKYLGLI